MKVQNILLAALSLLTATSALATETRLVLSNERLPQIHADVRCGLVESVQFAGSDSVNVRAKLVYDLGQVDETYEINEVIPAEYAELAQAGIGQSNLKFCMRIPRATRKNVSFAAWLQPKDKSANF